MAKPPFPAKKTAPGKKPMPFGKEGKEGKAAMPKGKKPNPFAK